MGLDEKNAPRESFSTVIPKNSHTNHDVSHGETIELLPNFDLSTSIFRQRNSLMSYFSFNHCVSKKHKRTEHIVSSFCDGKANESASSSKSVSWRPQYSQRGRTTNSDTKICRSLSICLFDDCWRAIIHQIRVRCTAKGHSLKQWSILFEDSILEY